MKKGIFRHLKELFHGKTVCIKEYCTETGSSFCDDGYCVVCHDIWCNDRCKKKMEKPFKIVPGGWRESN